MGKHTLFTGAGVALVTPMTADGCVHYRKYRELIEQQIEAGVDAIIAVGTTGEASTLAPDEIRGVMETAVEQTKGRVPVICGAGSNDTAHTIELCDLARDCGADGVLLVTPYYNKTSQRGLVAHYSHVANRTELPIILYNVPSRTGLDLRPETVCELAKHPRIVGLKAAGSHLSDVADVAAGCDIDIYAGNDDQIVPVLSLGGKGVISVLANVVPRQTATMCKRWFAGDVDGSRRLQLEWLPLIRALFSDVNPIPVKQAMNFMGMNVGECRLPLCRMSAGGKDHLRAVLEGYRLM